MTTTAAKIRAELGLAADTPTDEVVAAIREVTALAACAAEFDTASDFDTLDPHGARVHVDAVAALAARGVHDPTADQLALAYDRAGYGGKAA